MTRERMREIALKFWHLKLRDPNFKNEAGKIRRNSTRIAGKMKIDPMVFDAFLMTCQQTRTHKLIPEQLTGETGEVALRFTEHRISQGDGIKINNALRRRVIDTAAYIGEPTSDCLEFVRTLLINQINKHLS